jgi:hypothetical protein
MAMPLITSAGREGCVANVAVTIVEARNEIVNPRWDFMKVLFDCEEVQVPTRG